MRRPAIAMHRIKEYDGEYVVFSYMDKTDGDVKTEKVTVEEFIPRLTRHIPDENFKTIRYYGVYSRRIKTLCKTMVTAWQKEARKWIVKIKRVMKRRNWRERVKEGTGKDPLVCPKCECYYGVQGRSLSGGWITTDQVRRMWEYQSGVGEDDSRSHRYRKNERLPRKRRNYSDPWASISTRRTP